MEEIIKTVLEQPEEANVLITELINRYKPLFYSVIGEAFGIYKDLVSNQDFFNTDAQFTWNRFKALTDCGFTEDQAMSIILKEDKRLEQQMVKNASSMAKYTKNIKD